MDTLVQGILDGSFTGKKLADYFRPEEEPDFFNARAMINSDKHRNGEKIAGHARRYLAAMTRPTDPDWFPYLPFGAWLQSCRTAQAQSFCAIPVGLRPSLLGNATLTQNSSKVYTLC